MVLIIKRITVFLLCICLCCMCTVDSCADFPTLSADCAVICNADGQELYSKNGDKRVLIASTTKLMTAIIAIEKLDITQRVEIQPQWCGIEGSSMYLRAGQELSIEELLYGLLLVSGNDAAIALACITAGDCDTFARMMNEKARELGMENSSFQNPHGLDAPEHYSSAGDMARLMCYCMKNAVFARIIGTATYKIGEQMLVNHNKLLNSLPGCTGGKTGYTKAAGRCLVSSCSRDGLELICVTMSAPDDWNDHIRLYEWGYAKFCRRNAAEGLVFEVPVVSGVRKKVAVRASEDVWVFCRRDESLQAVAELPHFTFAPVKQGEAAGQLKIIQNGTVAGTCPLVFCEDVSLRGVLP